MVKAKKFKISMTIRFSTVLIVTVLVTACFSRPENIVNSEIIPLPNQITEGKGYFIPKKTLTLSFNDTTVDAVIGKFITTMRDVWEIVYADASNTDIRIEYLPEAFREAEAYELQISRKGIILKAGSLHGLFNGLQSVRQLLMAASLKSNSGIAAVLIKDHPRFGWRGMMLDESRHFFGIERVKEMLDQMALHKLNTFHWHLTDEPGWRIEIKSYPLLTEVGGEGSYTDHNAPVNYYTQDQIREVIAYAADRFIEVIPEVDMPGHATAANRAYPEFSGGGSERNPEFTFDPGNEGTYAYLTAILREVANLFPSKYIHIGGDEVHFGNQQWSKNKGINNLMNREGLNTLGEVESYFVKRMADSVAMLGKTLIGWDEIVDHGLNTNNSIVMWWRHDKPGKLEEALKEKFPVVMCPRVPFYLDFVQHEIHKTGRRWQGAFSPLDLGYAFPPDTLPGFLQHYDQIRGVQANIWTEAIKSTERLQFMTYPRMSALAESAWTMPENKDYDQFLERLKVMINHYKNEGLYIFDPFNPEAVVEPEL